MATDTKPPAGKGPTLSLTALSKNKPLLYGGAAAVGLGLYALYRKKTGAASGGTPTANASTAAGTYNGTAGIDTTGTDVASWLGNYSGSLQSQLDAYSQQLTSALQGVSAVTPSAGPPGVVTGLTQDPNSTRGALSFHWTPVPGATQYQVYEQSDLGGSAPMLVTDPNVTWSGLTPGVKHEFFVRAIGPGGTQSTPATIFAWPDPSLK